MSSNNKTLNKAMNKSKGFMKSVSSKVTSNKVMMALVGIFMLIVVGMVVYWIYQRTLSKISTWGFSKPYLSIRFN